MADVTAAEIEQGLDGLRVVIRDWRPLDKNPDMAIGTVANPHGLAAELKAEIDSYPSFGPGFTLHNPSPLTCGGCTAAPATVLVVLGRTNADRSPAPGHVLLLHCRDCAGKCKDIVEGGGRAVSFFSIGPEEGTNG
jgi:hypothetical protein